MEATTTHTATHNTGHVHVAPITQDMALAVNFVQCSLKSTVFVTKSKASGFNISCLTH